MKNHIEIAAEVIRFAQASPELYLQQLDSQFELPDGLLFLVEQHGRPMRVRQHKGVADVSAFIEFGTFALNDFSIKYQCFFQFSKLAKVYRCYYMYDIMHPDPQATTGGYISGEAYMPMIAPQLEFEEEVLPLLEQAGFRRLDPRHLDTVLCDLVLPDEGFKFFGEQTNVYMILFTPFFDTREG